MPLTEWGRLAATKCELEKKKGKRGNLAAHCTALSTRPSSLLEDLRRLGQVSSITTNSLATQSSIVDLVIAYRHELVMLVFSSTTWHTYMADTLSWPNMRGTTTRSPFLMDAHAVTKQYGWHFKCWPWSRVQPHGASRRPTHSPPARTTRMGSLRLSFPHSLLLITPIIPYPTYLACENFQRLLFSTSSLLLLLSSKKNVCKT